MTRKEIVATYTLIALFCGAIYGALGGVIAQNMNTGLIVGGIGTFGSFSVLMFFGGAFANERQK